MKTSASAPRCTALLMATGARAACDKGAIFTGNGRADGAEGEGREGGTQRVLECVRRAARACA